MGKLDRRVVYKHWPFVVVGCVVRRGDKFLLVQEAEKDRGLWNQPAGWLEKGENIIEGAKREVKEETGLEIEIKGLLGIFSLFRKNIPERKINVHAIKVIFAAEAIGGKIKFAPSEIMAARWFSQREIEKMDKTKLRDMDIKEAVKRFFDGKIYPLEIVHHTVINYK